MRTIQPRSYLRSALLCAAMLVAATPFQAAAQTQPPAPAYMNVIVGGASPGPADTARQNVLALNTAMFGLYGNSGQVFRRNILAQHPVILALFTGAGGRMILYRPGQASLDAPSVPGVYQ